MQCGAAVSEVILHFGKGVSENGDLSLNLLKAIDDTVEWLTGMQKEADGAVVVGEGIVKALRGCKRVKLIDPDLKLRDLYVSVEEKLKKVIKLLGQKRKAAELDHSLGEHQADLVREFNIAIKSITQLHDTMVALRWAVAEHDADMEEPVGKACASADDLFRLLKIQ